MWGLYLLFIDFVVYCEFYFNVLFYFIIILFIFVSHFFQYLPGFRRTPSQSLTCAHYINEAMKEENTAGSRVLSETNQHTHLILMQLKLVHVVTLRVTV